MSCMGKFFNWGGSAAESAARVATMDARKAIEDCYKAIKEMTKVNTFNGLNDVKNSEIRIEGDAIVFERKKTVDGETFVEYSMALSAGGILLKWQDERGHYKEVNIDPAKIIMCNSSDFNTEITPAYIRTQGTEEGTLRVEALLEEISSLKERVAALENK